jgi:polar amino acid transport system substrate-binding protein
MLRKTTIGLLGILIVLAAFSGPAMAELAATDLRYFTEEYPPYNFQEEGEMQGISVDLLRLIWEEMAVAEQPIRVVPWARGYRNVQERPGTVLFAMGRTEEREEMFQWVCPITVNRQVLIARADRDIRIDSLEDAKKYRIGTILEDVADNLLNEAGFENLQQVNNFDLNVRKLDAGRIDLMAYGDTSFRKQVEKPEDYQMIYVLRELPACFAFHRDTPESLISNFQEAMDAIVARGDHAELVERYFGKVGVE